MFIAISIAINFAQNTAINKFDWKQNIVTSCWLVSCCCLVSLQSVEVCMNTCSKTSYTAVLQYRWWRKYLDLCYASPEEIPEWQRPRRATGNRRNLQCGDDSILRANATRDTGSPCLGAMGASVWGSALLAVGFSVLVSIFSAHWAWVERPSAPGSWGRYISEDSVHNLASARGHKWLATYVPVQDVLSQGILIEQ